MGRNAKLAMIVVGLYGMSDDHLTGEVSAVVVFEQALDLL